MCVRHPLRNLLLSAICLLASCVAASAQSSIAGLVRDESGAVLPGVTVEASSPALIDKAHSAVTNEQGQYRIVDLRPGTYKVTFSLSGFSTVARENILLQADFVATVNADLKVGAVEETVTVSGASPIVDVQSTGRREILGRDLLDAVPTGRNFQTVLNIVPSVSRNNDVGGSTIHQQGNVTAYGGAGGDMKLELDGLDMGSSLSAGASVGLYYADGQVQEYSISLAGGNADSATGGVRINLIPKEGSNQWKGMVFGAFSNKSLNKASVPPALASTGITIPQRLDLLATVEPSLGGPIVKDRLWMFGTVRVFEYDNQIFGNVTQADGSPVIDKNRLTSTIVRPTLQISRSTKLTGSFDKNTKFRQYRDIEMGNLLPEAALIQQHPSTYYTQAKLTSTITNNLLAEVGVGRNRYHHSLTYEPEIARPSASNPFGQVAKFDIIRNLRSGGNSTFGPVEQQYNKDTLLASLSYVSGAHQVKGGAQLVYGSLDNSTYYNGDIIQQYRNGVPDSVITINTPTHQLVNYRDIAFFLQDSWTIRRLTLNPGVRWQWLYAEAPATDAPAGRWVPARHFDAITDIPNFKLLTPRFGAAYDLFGTGKTAIRGSVGMFAGQIGYGLANTYSPMIVDKNTRTWGDANRNDFPELDELGPAQNVNFGIRRNRNMDPDLKAPYNLLYTVAVQHELWQGLGLTVSYNRRAFRNITFTKNLSALATDYTLLQVADPRGGGQIPVYSLSPAKLGLVNEIDTTSDNRQTYNGVDVTFTQRFGNGATIFGGTSTGRVRTALCQVTDPNTSRFCDQSQYDVPFLTSFKLSGSYPLPYGVRLSGVFSTTPGTEKIINYIVNPTIVRGLTQSTATIRLNEPGTQYYARINQLDFAVSKSFKVGRVTLKPQVEAFNLLNVQPVLTENVTFGSSLGRPLTILNGRMVRFGGQLEF